MKYTILFISFILINCTSTPIKDVENERTPFEKHFIRSADRRFPDAIPKWADGFPIILGYGGNLTRMDKLNIRLAERTFNYFMGFEAIRITTGLYNVGTIYYDQTKYLAVTHISDNTKYFNRADIILSDTVLFSYCERVVEFMCQDKTTEHISLVTVLMHEFMHVVGVDHILDDDASLVYPNISAGEVKYPTKRDIEIVNHRPELFISFIFKN